MRAAAVTCVLMLFFGAGVAEAQRCQATDRVVDCFDDIAGTAAQRQADATEGAATTAATGVTNMVSASESSLKDFLSLLAGSYESATTSENGDAFTFEWNPKFGLAPAVGLKFQAVFAETKLNDEVTKQLAGNTEVADSLTDSLEFGDDTVISGSAQPKTRSYGRSIAPHRTWFQNMMATTMDATAEENAALDAVGDLVQSADERLDFGTGGDEARINARVEAVKAAARAFKNERTRLANFSTAFAKLLNNQPQWYGSLIYHARRNVIGPNEWSGEFTYEFASNNLNAFKRKHPGCDPDSERPQLAPADCARELQAFAADTSSPIERVALSLEYHRVNRRWISDPTRGLDLGFPRSEAYVGTLAAGWNVAPLLPFGPATSGVGDGRLDLTAKYEMPEDDDSEEKGFVAALTYTQKISEGFSFPVSFVYSDHASDLLNVDKRFSARFGLMYKMPDLKALGLAR